MAFPCVTGAAVTSTRFVRACQKTTSGTAPTLNFENRIDRISVPTLFINGPEVHLGGPSTIMQGLAGAVSGARHVSVLNTVHLYNIQNPEESNEARVGFLRQQAR
jgi:pimeloyl-ACP methyl ester carboxylesterase